MLTALDWIVIVLYLLLTIATGLWYGGHQKDADDYFTGGGHMSSLFQNILVGLSIAATLFSGISFLAFPSIAYQYGVTVLIVLVSFVISFVVLKFWFLPRYMKNDPREPYQIIEEHFGVKVRTLAAAMFLLLRIGWMAALIYAPTIALMGAVGLEDHWFWVIAFTIGVSSTLYASLGGIRGVIATDALQFVVIAGSLVLAVIIIATRLPVSWPTAWQNLADTGRLKLANWSLNPSVPFTVWAMLAGFTVANLSSYVSDQMSLQRYITCGSAKAASRSFGINIVGVIAVVVLLCTVGLGLAAWYVSQPAPDMPGKPDQIFPYFIAKQLPSGITGLVLAAILAATMSSMTSGINTLSANITLDFRARFGSPMSAQRKLRYARNASLMIGLLATALAGAVSALGDIFDIAQTLLGAFLGPLLACVLASLLRLRVAPAVMMAGMLAGSLAAWFVAFSPCQSLWVAPSAFMVSMAVVGAGIILKPHADVVPSQA